MLFNSRNFLTDLVVLRFSLYVTQALKWYLRWSSHLSLTTYTMALPTRKMCSLFTTTRRKRRYMQTESESLSMSLHLCLFFILCLSVSPLWLSWSTLHLPWHLSPSSLSLHLSLFMPLFLPMYHIQHHTMTKLISPPPPPLTSSPSPFPLPPLPNPNPNPYPYLLLLPLPHPSSSYPFLTPPHYLYCSILFCIYNVLGNLQ